MKKIAQIMLFFAYFIGGMQAYKALTNNVANTTVDPDLLNDGHNQMDTVLNVGFINESLTLLHSNKTCPLFLNDTVSTTFHSFLNDTAPRALRIHCYSEHMVIFAEKQKLTCLGIFNETQLIVGMLNAQDSSCYANKHASNKTHFVLASLYSHCGTTKSARSNENEIFYNNEIFLRSHSDYLIENFFNRTQYNNNDEKCTVSGMVVFSQKFSCPIYLNETNSQKHDYRDNHHIEKNSNADHDQNAKFENLRQLFENDAQKQSIIEDFGESELMNDQELLSQQDGYVMDTNSQHGSNNYTFRLKLYDEYSTNKYSNSRYPMAVVAHSPLFVEISLAYKNPDAVDYDLMVSPKDCHFSENSNPAIEPSHMVLTSGCSANNANATFYYEKLPNNQTVRFTLLADMFFPERHFMFFHCKIAACSKRGNRENENLEKCPSKDYCSESASRLSAVPANFDPAYSFVSSGPLRPTFYRPANSHRKSQKTYSPAKPDVKPMQADAASSDLPSATCLPCPVDEKPSSTDGQQKKPTSSSDSHGVDMVTVVFIAASAFILGIVVTAGLRFIHKKTEPKVFSPANTYRKSYTSAATTDSGYSRDTTASGWSSAAGADPQVTSPMTGNEKTNKLLLAKKFQLPCCYDDQDDESETAAEKCHRPMAVIGNSRDGHFHKNLLPRCDC